ncbi:MAG: hypothetical protein KAT04_09670 [Methylococcales bacterium]|nr:hypothetical protein [Methylococcales bacterium]
MKNIGWYLMAVWLIAQSVLTLTHFHFSHEKTILAALALVAGIFMLMYFLKNSVGNIGILLLSTWLILKSSLVLFHFSFSHSSTTLAVLGLVTGVFLMVRK